MIIIKLKIKVTLVKEINQSFYNTNWTTAVQHLLKLKKKTIIKKLLLNIKLCQKLVRFCADYRIKPHAPPLVLAPVNFFEFQFCKNTFQVKCFIMLISESN